MGTTSRGWRWARAGVVLCAGLVVGLVPVPAQAEPTVFGTLTLSEVQEFLRLKKGRDLESIVFRLANATLVGTGGGAICAGGPAPCPMDASAQSQVSLQTFRGPIEGFFDVLFDTNPASELLSDLLFTARARIHGEMDLGPAVIFQATSGAAGLPIATVSGHWRSRDLGVRGTFTGTFYIPIPFPFCPSGHAYIVGSSVSEFQCLEPSDFSLGAPVTRLSATLVKTGTTGRND